jgi:molybdate transport system substrate-binding protein
MLAENAREGPMKAKVLLPAVLAAGLALQSAGAADLKVLTAGAYKQVLLAMQPDFEKESDHRLVIDNDTVGALVKRIDGGETFDIVVASPVALDGLIKSGKVADGTRRNLARVGIGIMVKAGEPKPDVSTLAAFKQAVLSAKSISYVDPASGGTTGIYLAKLFDQLGIAAEVGAKAKLKHGGLVSDLIIGGEAELGLQQMSEIVPIKGVHLVGPLPAEIQLYTIYAAGIAAGTKERTAADALVRFLAAPAAAPVLKTMGMDAPSL